MGDVNGETPRDIEGVRRAFRTPELPPCTGQPSQNKVRLDPHFAYMQDHTRSHKYIQHRSPSSTELLQTSGHPRTVITDPDGDFLTFTVTDGKSGSDSGLPSWLTFDPMSMLLSGAAPQKEQDVHLLVTGQGLSGEWRWDRFGVAETLPCVHLGRF